MLLLIDIGNTHTHVGLARGRRLVRRTEVPTPDWRSAKAGRALIRWVGDEPLRGAALCSVVPEATPRVVRCIRQRWGFPPLVLTPQTLVGLGIDYPRPDSIGPDRLANAVAARWHFGEPVVVLDFGTALTFDVVNGDGNYVGGVIAPGLSAMTDYLHEKTALLPRIAIRDTRTVIGRSTEEAMLIGAVHGYRGLVRAILGELQTALGSTRLPVVATGGYAQLLARHIVEIQAVRPGLTLEGLRLVWENRGGPAHRSLRR
jgi:type III pantothenate kinase